MTPYDFADAGGTADTANAGDARGPAEAADAYDARAEFLAEVLGKVVSEGDPDRRVIEEWADGVSGRILDVGSGTGRWSGHLSALGHAVDGLEPAGRFVKRARQSFPAVPFRKAAIADLDASNERWAGVLAWYSLIHMNTEELPAALTCLRRVLDQGGKLLLSLFTGPRFEPIDHPATTAYIWPMEQMAGALRRAGFEVTGQRSNPGAPHAVITARAVN